MKNPPAGFAGSLKFAHRYGMIKLKTDRQSSAEQCCAGQEPFCFRNELAKTNKMTKTAGWTCAV
jgi:hypothetical protein